MASKNLDGCTSEPYGAYIYECGLSLSEASNEYMFVIRSNVRPGTKSGNPRFYIKKSRGAITLHECAPDSTENVENETTFLQHGNVLMRCDEPDALITDPSMYVEVKEGMKALRFFLPEDKPVELELRGYRNN